MGLRNSAKEKLALNIETQEASESSGIHVGTGLSRGRKCFTIYRFEMYLKAICIQKRGKIGCIFFTPAFVLCTALNR